METIEHPDGTYGSTASVEQSFRKMKLIKSHLHLMRIAIEGPQLTDFDFARILDILKQKNRRILL